MPNYQASSEEEGGIKVVTGHRAMFKAKTQAVVHRHSVNVLALSTPITLSLELLVYDLR
jgi:ribulose-5-phosphate 4-epimerase/fuculose-1-phosphate aldolase